MGKRKRCIIDKGPTTLLATAILLLIAIIFGNISHRIIIIGVSIAIDMKWPYCLKKLRRIRVSIADDIRFTNRLPMRIVMSIFSGFFINPEIDFSFRCLDVVKR